MSSSGDLFKLVGRILIENADAISAIDDTTEKAKGLAQTLQGTGTEADNTSKKLGSSGKLGSTSVWLGNMFTKLTDLGFGIGKFIGKTGFAHNSMMEQYQTAFGVLIGDAEKAQKLLDDLWIMAADTPMEMTGLAENARDLLNYGIAVEKIIPMLYMLGDASLGSQKKMDGIAYAFGQISSYGALRGQETMQLIENGFPILEMLEKTMQMSKGDLLDMREKGNILFEDVLEAFEYAVTDDRFAGAMDKYTKTFEGQKAKLSDNFSQTIGNLTLAFFELSKSDVIPQINKTLEEFGTWVSNNQETLEKMADAVGGLITVGFDAIINAFTWMVDNGEATALAIGTIATAMTIGAIAAHPYAAAVLAVAAGLAMLASAPDDPYAKQFDGFSSQDLQVMQDYVDAMNAVKKAEAAYLEDSSEANFNAHQSAVEMEKMAKDKAMAIEGLISAYNTWHSGQANYMQDGMYLDVPLKVAEGSEEALQSGLDVMNLGTYVEMIADTSGLYDAVNATNLTAYVNLKPTGTISTGSTDVKWNADGAVFHKPTIFNTRYGLQGVGEAGSEVVSPIGVLQQYVSDAVASQNAGMVSVLQSMLSTLNQINANTAAGHQVVLDTGIVAGQMAPILDEKLGAIGSRKGRRN